MGSQFCVSHITLAPEIMGNIDEGYFNFLFFFGLGGGGGVGCGQGGGEGDQVEGVDAGKVMGCDMI